MSILVANPCTSNAAPKLYVGEVVTDLYEIRNAKKGDIAIVALVGSFSVWRFYESYTPPEGSTEGVDYIAAQPCGWFVLSGTGGSGSQSGIFSVTDYGATGEEDDETAYFAAAVAAVPVGSEIYVPEGTYILHNLDVNRNVGFRMHPAAVLLHRAAATNHMIRMTVPNSIGIKGGILDGNKANQSSATNWFALLYNYADGQVLRDVTFRNYMKAAILDDQTIGAWWVDRCQFLNGFEVETLDAFSNGAITFQAAVAAARAKITVTDSLFSQAANPVAGKRAPGAFYSAGSDALDCRPSIIFKNNRIHLMGGRHPTLGHGRAAIDFYETTLNGVCSGNIVSCASHNNTAENWIPGKFDNCQNLDVDGNIVTTPGPVAFRYVPGERAQTTEFTTAKFRGNTVHDSPAAIAFLIDAAVGGFRDVQVTNNTARGVLKGLDINGLLDDAVTNKGYGPLLISGNQLFVSGGNGIEIDSTQGDIKITDNHLDVTGGVGIRATTDNAAASLNVRGNTIICRTAANPCVRLWGLKELHLIGNTFDQVTGSAAIELDADGAANKILKLVKEDNIIRTGTESIDYTGIGKVYGERIIDSYIFVAGNINADETDLWSYAAPAGLLANNGEALEWYATGRTAANANNKHIRVYFGGTTLYDSTAQAVNDVDYILRGTITRHNATAVRTSVSLIAASTGTSWTIFDEVVGVETLANALTFRITGQGVASNDIFLVSGKMKFVGVP